MKSVMLSIQPKWIEKILNKEKTIEIRKRRPKIETPFKVYIYCTNSERPLVYGQYRPESIEKYQLTHGISRNRAEQIFEVLNGKVVAEFICDEVRNFYVYDDGSIQGYEQFNLNDSCISEDKIAKYIGNDCNGYAWHISNLKIYDEPKALSEFYIEKVPTSGCSTIVALTRAPQSYCYVEELR